MRYELAPGDVVRFFNRNNDSARWEFSVYLGNDLWVVPNGKIVLSSAARTERALEEGGVWQDSYYDLRVVRVG